MSQGVRILLIDDDRELCHLLEELLRREGFTVAMEHDGAKGLSHAQARPPDLIVLDVMLPGIDGLEVLRELRRSQRTPVLMLTARGEDIDRIIGLELGADDYLPKPFHPRELIARIRAILRRVEEPRQPPGGRLEVNGVVLDPESRQVTVAGREVELTTFEFEILERLMQAAGRVLSRDALTESLYRRKATPFDRAIDVHVSHLRRKLGDERLIRTVRGVGYQFCRTRPEEGGA